MAKPKAENGQIVPGLSNEKAFDLLETLNTAHMKHVTQIVVCENGDYHFHDGQEMYEMKDVDITTAAGAAKYKAGFRKESFKMPGKYINCSKIVKTYTPQDILDDSDDIMRAHKESVKAQKKAALARQGEDMTVSAGEMLDAIKKIQSTVSTT
jgi:hypothetical protein